MTPDDGLRHKNVKRNILLRKVVCHKAAVIPTTGSCSNLLFLKGNLKQKFFLNPELSIYILITFIMSHNFIKRATERIKAIKRSLTMNINIEHYKSIKNLEFETLPS